MLHGNFPRLNRIRRPIMEALEGRRLLSSSATAATSPTPRASPALIVALAILKSNQVVGTYKGSAVITGLQDSIPMRLVVRRTFVKLTFTGYGTLTIKLSAHQFEQLRHGNFTLTAPLGPNTVTLSASVTQNGKDISGTINSSGGPTISGTFSLTKR